MTYGFTDVDGAQPNVWKYNEDVEAGLQAPGPLQGTQKLVAVEMRTAECPGLLHIARSQRQPLHLAADCRLPGAGTP